MFEAADIREWRGHDVVDPEGHKIGELEAIYVDTSTDLPAFAPLKSGCRPGTGSRSSGLRDRGSGIPQGRPRQETSERFPPISTDGELPAADEEAIFKHYGLTYQSGTSGERQLARR